MGTVLRLNNNVTTFPRLENCLNSLRSPRDALIPRQQEEV